MLSVVLSIAVGASPAGAVNGVTWTSGGRKGASVVIQELVMLWVALGFTRRMFIAFCEDIVELAIGSCPFLPFVCRYLWHTMVRA